MKKRIGSIILAAVMALGLTGCADADSLRLNLNPQELYALPELPDRYTELNSQLSVTLSEGAEYAAPTSGTNVQPVQMVDLDSDGTEEAVAFFRSAEQERPLKICI